MTFNIKQPTMLLNETICRRNIRRMAEKAEQSGVRFRPHFKTHQSAQIGDWFRSHGVTGITASSLAMARYFKDHGWQDITVAFPVNWLEIDTINALAAEITLGLIVESLETVQFLNDNLQYPVNIWLDVDTGYGRTGIAWDDSEGAAQLAGAVEVSPHMRLTGMLTHAGHSYAARSNIAIQGVYDETVERFQSLRDQLDFDDLQISIGDTPTCSVVNDLSAVDEIRPGNFVFYDMMQVNIGSCTVDDVAVGVACPVVAKQERFNQIVVYGGGVHLSKDSIVDRAGRQTFGAVAHLTEDGWGPILPETYVKSLSQEHGVLHADAKTLEQVKVGDVLVILPVHSCMTANLLKTYVTISGGVIEMAG